MADEKTETPNPSMSDADRQITLAVEMKKLAMAEHESAEIDEGERQTVTTTHDVLKTIATLNTALLVIVAMFCDKLLVNAENGRLELGILMFMLVLFIVSLGACIFGMLQMPLAVMIRKDYNERIGAIRQRIRRKCFIALVVSGLTFSFGIVELGTFSCIKLGKRVEAIGNASKQTAVSPAKASAPVAVPDTPK